MTRIGEALYTGTVVHKRVQPRAHTLRYSVFSCLFDCDRLDALGDRLTLFSYNRFNLFSLYDRDHLDGTALREALNDIARRSGQGDSVRRFMMLCYPRVLGYAFNPLTVYFGLDADDRIRLLVYEVRNTFGGRMTYVLPAEPDAAGVISHHCRKQFYVSPFNDVDGRYDFHVTTPGEALTVGVALRTGAGPLLLAHFRGRRADLTDRRLIGALGRTGWMTVKVIAAIHYEALKLWLKGLPLVKRPANPANPITFVAGPEEEGKLNG